MAIHHDTRTTHTITVEIPDDVIGKLEMNDDIELILVSRVASGRTPAPIKLSWSMKRWLIGRD